MGHIGYKLILGALGFPFLVHQHPDILHHLIQVGCHAGKLVIANHVNGSVQVPFGNALDRIGNLTDIADIRFLKNHERNREQHQTGYDIDQHHRHMVAEHCLDQAVHPSRLLHVPGNHGNIGHQEYLHQTGNNGTVYDIGYDPRMVAPVHITFQFCILLPTPW